MAIYAVTELKIGNEKIGGEGFSNTFADYALCEFSLETGLLRPTVFRFKIRKKELGRSEDKITLKDPITNNMLGKKVSCTVTTNEHAGELKFIGTVLEAEADKLYITGTAYSADYVLNDAPCCKSYLGNTLREVISDTLSNHIELNANGGILNKKIGYIVRYNETSYQFLTRLARQYGLYMKSAIIINDIGGEPTEVLQISESKPLVFTMFDMNLISDDGYTGFTYKLKTKFPKPAYMVLDDYHCKNWHTWRKMAMGDDVGGEAMVKRVHGRSKEIFSIPDDDPMGNHDVPKSYYDYSVYHNQEIDAAGNDWLETNNVWLENMVNRHTSCLRSQYVECTLTTHRANLQLLDVITMKERVNDENKDHEQLLVVGLKYTWDATGNFVGTVTAIPNVCIAPPYFDPDAYPKSGVQRAKVVDNKDVKKMGRVKVQFVWQGAWLPANSGVTFAQGVSDASPWIPVAQPYASSSGTGCFVIPEIGDEVLVGFEHDNVEKPYVIGVLYHGTEGENANKKDYKPDDKWAKLPGADKKPNVVKALRTRSGQTIEIHDDCDEDNVQDKNGFVRIYTNPLAQNNAGGNNNDENNAANAAPREYDIVLSKDEWRTAKDIDKALTADDANKVKIGVASDGSIVISCAENLVLKAKNVKIIADEKFDMSVAGKKEGQWNKAEGWKVTEYGTTVSISKDKMEVSAVGKDTKMTVLPTEANKAAQKFDLTIGKSSISVNGKKDVEKIDVKANESFVTVDGKKDSEKIDVKAKESFVTVDGKNGAEKIDVKAKGSSVTVDGNGKAIVIKTDGSISVEGSTDLKLKGDNASLEGTQKLEMKGAKASLEGSTDLKLKGANASLEGSTSLKLEGAETDVHATGALNLTGHPITENKLKLT